jgi:hypothetical protein
VTSVTLIETENQNNTPILPRSIPRNKQWHPTHPQPPPPPNPNPKTTTPKNQKPNEAANAAAPPPSHPPSKSHPPNPPPSEAEDVAVPSPNPSPPTPHNPKPSPSHNPKPSPGALVLALQVGSTRSIPNPTTDMGKENGRGRVRERRWDYFGRRRKEEVRARVGVVGR